jgi:hypothetical protein
MGEEALVVEAEGGCRGTSSRPKVFNKANWIFSGACSNQAFVYTPGMYSVSNEDFVRGSVTNFYESYNQKELSAFFEADNEDKVCPKDDLEEELASRNNELTKYCAATQLERLQDALRIARRVVHMIVEFQYILVNLIFAFARLLIAAEDFLEATLAEIEFWFLRMVMLIWESLKEIGNLIFRVIFDSGGFGSFLKWIVEAICRTVNVILTIFNYTGCWVLKEIWAPVFRHVISIFGKIITLFVPSASPVVDALNKINNEMRKMTCNYTLGNCSFPVPNRPNLPDGANPVATRCWANYVPGIDESDAFSCSRSDTCMVSTLQAGVTSQEFGGLTEDGRQVSITPPTPIHSPTPALTPEFLFTLTGLAVIISYRIVKYL